RVIATPQSVPGMDTYFITGWTAVIGIVVLALTGLWFLTPLFSFTGGAERAFRIWTRDALLHLPVSTVLLVLLLLSADIRFPSDFFFSRFAILAALALLVACKVFSIGIPSGPHSRLPAVWKQRSSTDPGRYWPAILGAIVL